MNDMTSRQVPVKDADAAVARRAGEPSIAVSPALSDAIAPIPAPWSTLVDAAHARWRWVTVPDFLSTGGRERPLADLVCQRYGIAHDDAVHQVRRFLAQHPVAV